MSLTTQEFGNRSLPQIIRANRRQVNVLPEPEAEWTVGELEGDYVRRQLERLLSVGIIERVRWTEDTHPNSRVGVYQTSEDAWEWLQHYQHTEKRDRLLPCDDRDCPGQFFTNPRDRDGIVCKDCGQEHDPEEL